MDRRGLIEAAVYVSIFTVSCLLAGLCIYVMDLSDGGAALGQVDGNFGLYNRLTFLFLLIFMGIWLFVKRKFGHSDPY